MATLQEAARSSFILSVQCCTCAIMYVCTHQHKSVGSPDLVSRHLLWPGGMLLYQTPEDKVQKLQMKASQQIKGNDLKTVVSGCMIEGLGVHVCQCLCVLCESFCRSVCACVAY